MNDSKIEWTDDTVNPWFGCTKVSPACTNCYAETLDARFRMGGEAHWGPQASRFLRVKKAIHELDAIARRAAKEGRKRRVFIASMADIFEDRADLVEPRRVFLANLDAIQGYDQPLLPLLLTKRPEVALAYARANPWPSGAMLGVTVEDQRRADERIPVALQVAALTGCGVFLSCEPLLGPVDLGHLWRHGWSWPVAEGSLEQAKAAGTARLAPYRLQAQGARLISWVIVGGESGRGARPMHPAWARSLRDQCVSAGVPFFFKQSGEWIEVPPAAGVVGDRWSLPAPLGLVPYIEGDGRWYMAPLMRRVGKKSAGRLLDGRTWDELPGASR
jgi:protein gp37